MADAKVQIGLSTDFLEGTSVNTPAGDNLFREGVVVSDPTDAQARAKITNTAPAADAYGLVVRMVGNLAIGTEVEVKNDAGNPLAVSVGNFPATQAVSGTVAATQSGVWSVGRTWNLAFANDKADVSGSSVSVANFPATQAVSGSVTVSQATAANLNATVTGTVAATQSGTWTTGRTWSLSNATDSVNVGNFPATQAVSGTVAATQSGVWNITNITGTVSLPAGAATAAKQLPDNHQVTVSNFPATQAVSGSVAVNNFPATQAVSGTVSVGNFPATQAVTDANVTGTWGYAAGTSGTVNVPAGAKVLQISATSTLGGSFTVNGGAAITIPANQQFTLEPRGNLVAPTVVFTSTASYVIEYVS